MAYYNSEGNGSRPYWGIFNILFDEQGFKILSRKQQRHRYTSASQCKKAFRGNFRWSKICLIDEVLRQGVGIDEVLIRRARTDKVRRGTSYPILRV